MKKLLFSLVLSIWFHQSFAQFTKLLDFENISKGTYPYGTLYSDGDFLYGMTSIGGAHNFGTLFKVKHDGTEFTKLLDFDGANNGRNPYGNVISDGTYLYGMTNNGGANDMGTIFKIKPDGTAYTKLLDFEGTTNGRNPWGSLIANGNELYGMTFSGGSNSMGTVFKILSDGSGYTKLLDFAGLTNGRNPRGSLFFDGTYLYGMTSVGGSENFGTLFKLLPNGTGYLKLLDFDSITNGRNPYGNVISDGTYLYGTTSGSGTNSSSNFGTIFKITPTGTGYTKLLEFDGATKGRYPYGSLVFDGTALYGMTFQGGLDNWGTLYKILPNGTGFSKLADFDGISKGMNPWGSLISSGNTLYGMTSGGGVNSFAGVLFKYDTSTLSTASHLWKDKYRVYPNPSSALVTIEIENDLLTATASIYTLLGQKISSFSIQTNKINVSLSKGIYMVQIEKDGHKTTQKIVVY